MTDSLGLVGNSVAAIARANGCTAWAGSLVGAGILAGVSLFLYATPVSGSPSFTAAAVGHPGRIRMASPPSSCPEIGCTAGVFVELTVAARYSTDRRSTEWRTTDRRTTDRRSLSAAFASTGSSSADSSSGGPSSIVSSAPTQAATSAESKPGVEPTPETEPTPEAGESTAEALVFALLGTIVGVLLTAGVTVWRDATGRRRTQAAALRSSVRAFRLAVDTYARARSEPALDWGPAEQGIYVARSELLTQLAQAGTAFRLGTAIERLSGELETGPLGAGLTTGWSSNPVQRAESVRQDLNRVVVQVDRLADRAQRSPLFRGNS